MWTGNWKKEKTWKKKNAYVSVVIAIIANWQQNLVSEGVSVDEGDSLLSQISGPWRRELEWPQLGSDRGEVISTREKLVDHACNTLNIQMSELLLNLKSPQDRSDFDSLVQGSSSQKQCNTATYYSWRNFLFVGFLAKQGALIF